MNAKLEGNMLLDVIKVSAKENFTLELEFENGECRLFDCKSLLKTKPFEKLQNEHFFKRATVGYGTVVWSDEIDIAPETLYYESTPLKV